MHTVHNIGSIMFGLLCKRIIQDLKMKNCVGNSMTHLGIVQYNHTASSICNVVRFFSSLSCKKRVKLESDHSFTVSYLVNSCGLSLEDATIASQKVHFETPEMPDSVLSLLRNHGFSTTHISKFVKKRPLLLLANPEKTLLPKLEFFRSIGVPGADIARILSSDPTLFKRSLETYIIPRYNFLRSLVVDHRNVVTAIKSSSVMFRQRVEKNIAPNISVLRELGVPQSSISLMVTHFPNASFIAHRRFTDIVKKLMEMGFDPLKSIFVQAIKVMSGMGMPSLQDKFALFGRLGWSKDEAFSAFKHRPQCMVMSEKRIVRTMDILVNKMGWPSKLFARYPVVLCFSLEKRIIPRCLVVQVLLSKGLLKKEFSITTFFQTSEKYFLQRFVNTYEESVPTLMDVYEGKVNIRTLGIGLKDLCEIEQV